MKGSLFGGGWLLLLAGDIIVFAFVTLFGFASHGTLGSAGSRMLATWVPLWLAWLLIAPHLLVYREEITSEWNQLWRPLWAMILAAPFAAWLRGVWLGSPILPVFVVVLGGVSALAILAWRALFWAWRFWMDRRRG